jgi:hypothetical protein
VTDHSPYVNASLARGLWKAAHYWIAIWSGAGFVPRLDGDKIVMPKEWPEKFPDGPHLVDGLRPQLIGLLSKGNAAVSDDERLRISVAYQPIYEEYLEQRADAERLHERCVKYAAARDARVKGAK